jgi:hypothetical protein
MIASIIGWGRGSKVGIVLLVVAAVSVAGMVLVQGCNMGDIVKVNVPREVQKGIRIPSKITLNEYAMTMEEWIEHCERGTERFAAAGDRAYGIFNFMQTITTTGLGMGTTALESSGVPGGTIISMILAGGAGLMLKQPGAGREMQEAKEKSFNSGLRKAASIANGNGGTA